MKILLCNKFFYLRGGSERVFFDEAEMLTRGGHEVGFFSMEHSRNFSSPYEQYFVPGIDYAEEMGLVQKLKESGRIIYYREARKRLRRLLEAEKFDVAHLHNIHHQISPSILDELQNFGVPAVMTLHDYKMACPTYNLICNGEVCERCAGGRYFHCLLRRCTKGAYVKSLVNTLEMYIHHRIMGQYGKVAVFISPSKFLKEKLRQMGFPGEIVPLPNCIKVEEFQPDFGGEENSLVYFGRLSREKGVDILIDAVRGLEVTLKIVGEGPQRQELEEKVAKAMMDNVQFRGYLQGEALHGEIRRARLVVVPSQWYENNPISVLEAFALGKSVVGSRIGGIPELVRDFETGLTFESGNVQDLKEKIGFLLQHPDLLEEMGGRARRTVEAEFDAKRHYAGLMEVYQEVTGGKNKRKPGIDRQRGTSGEESSGAEK